MSKFDADVSKFLVTGIFSNNIDESGNVNLYTQPISASQEYVVYKLNVNLYDNEKIKTLYEIGRAHV